MPEETRPDKPLQSPDQEDTGASQMHHESQSQAELLRKLHLHRTSELPGQIAQRLNRHFTLHTRGTAPLPHDLVAMLVYPQNPFMGQPEVRWMSQVDVSPGLINDRFEIVGDIPPAQPDENGHYLYMPEQPEFEQVSAFYYATFTLRMFERYAVRPISWSFPSARLRINPRMGDQANAFYNERERLLGFHTYIDREGVVRSTAQSADVVTHEAAHAVLDGLRDFYNESFGLGPRAFHESFGDISAMLVALCDDTLIRRLLEWTHGDLRTSNFVSEIAEHLADALSSERNHIAHHSYYLRNAFNHLRYQAFDHLAYESSEPATTLSRQEHNYSRLFTGTIYDILVGIYERLREQGEPQFTALFRARDVIGYLTASAIEAGPVGEFDYGDMAQAYLTAERIQYEGIYSEILQQAFVRRGLLTPSQIESHHQIASQLPEIYLPNDIPDALAAAKYLETVLLKALALDIDHELIPFQIYRNGDGFVYMTFYHVETMQLQGPQFAEYDGSAIDLFGGLTLTFDEGDRLRSALYRPVKAEDRRQIAIIIADLIRHQQIVPVDAAMKGNGIPVGIWRPDGEAVRPMGKLVKWPVIKDEVYQHDSELAHVIRRIWDREA